MALEVLGLDHLYVTVGDIQRSERFYDPIMQALGFKKGSLPIGGEAHVHYFNRVMQYTLRPAHVSDERCDPYRTGALHHVCFQVRDAAAVDEAERVLTELGVNASPARLYPEYRPDYYATFFSDPDGIRLEVVCDTDGRRLLRDRWHELPDFVDPVKKLREREGASVSRGAPPTTRVGNLWRGARAPDTGELIEQLARLGGARVERIMSSSSPDPVLYDQEDDEWVVLLRGEAALEVKGERLELGAGDHVLLPAHTQHRVLGASPGALWLAFHVPAQKP